MVSLVPSATVSGPGGKRLSVVRLRLWEAGLNQDETGLKGGFSESEVLYKRCLIQPHTRGFFSLIKVINSVHLSIRVSTPCHFIIPL